MGTLKRYIFWTYDRGSVHYDVMVTLILLFIFVSPRFINFRDKPAEHVPRPGEVMVTSENGSLAYQVNAKELNTHGTEQELEHSMMRVIEPISGGVAFDHYEPVKDPSGRVVAYKVWVH